MSLREAIIFLLVNDPQEVFYATVTVPFSTSNHNAIQWSIMLLISAHDDNFDNYNNVNMYNFKRANYDALLHYLGNINWITSFNCCTPNDIENIFISVVMSVVAQYVPLRANHSVVKTKRMHNYPCFLRRMLNIKRQLWQDRHYSEGFDRYYAYVRKCKKKLHKFYANKEIKFIPPKVVYEAMCKATHSFSAGLDGLPFIILVKLASVLALPVSILFAASYKFAILPSAWRHACV